MRHERRLIRWALTALLVGAAVPAWAVPAISGTLQPGRSATLRAPVSGMVAAVTAVNEQLAQARREKALLSIDGKLAEVQAKLDAASAAPDLSNKALRPLQDLKARIAGQASIAQIMLLQEQGGDAIAGGGGGTRGHVHG